MLVFAPLVLLRYFSGTPPSSMYKWMFDSHLSFQIVKIVLLCMLLMIFPTRRSSLEFYCFVLLALLSTWIIQQIYFLMLRPFPLCRLQTFYPKSLSALQVSGAEEVDPSWTYCFSPYFKFRFQAKAKMLLS